MSELNKDGILTAYQEQMLIKDKIKFGDGLSPSVGKPFLFNSKYSLEARIAKHIIVWIKKHRKMRLLKMVRRVLLAQYKHRWIKKY